MSDDENDGEDDCDSNPNTGSQNENSVASGIAKLTAASRFGNGFSFVLAFFLNLARFNFAVDKNFKDESD